MSFWCSGRPPCFPRGMAPTAGHPAWFSSLFAPEAEVDLVHAKRQTALYAAILKRNVASAKSLLEAGADPNGSQDDYTTPVYHAVRRGSVDILKDLIRFKADVDYHLGPGHLFSAHTLTTLVDCPLYVSALQHNLECFRLLLQAGAQPDFNCTGPVSHEALTRDRKSCLLEAVLRLGCEVTFIHLLLDHGANLAFVPWDGSELENPNGKKVDPEALRVFLEARRNPRRLMYTCRIVIRKTMGKHRLSHISSLPLPEPIKNFLLHQN